MHPAAAGDRDPADPVEILRARWGLPQHLDLIYAGSMQRLPFIRFHPATRRQAVAPGSLLKAARDEQQQQESLSAGGSTSSLSSTRGDPGGRGGGGGGGGAEAGSGGRRRVSHVEDCTCAQCRKALRRPERLPTRLTFKVNNTDARLVRATLAGHGFVLTNKVEKKDWNVLWTGSHLKSYVFQGLSKHQRVNQFPRSAEITRKDTLCRTIRRMQELFGAKHFDFCPVGFVLPKDSREFLQYAQAQGPDATWIVKPAGQACGRGIYLTRDVDEIPTVGLEESVQVSTYVERPLLIDRKKFDLRLYVGVTSFNPMRIYLFEEGLARFATHDYQNDAATLGDRFCHLTNYSINKQNHEGFVRNTSTGEAADGGGGGGGVGGGVGVGGGSTSR